MELEGKIALVTGGAVRLGRALLLALAEAGADVVLHYGSSRRAAEETAAAVRDLGRKVLLLQADLQDMAAVQQLPRRAAEKFGKLDILVNSAALFQPGDIFNTTEASWDRQMNVNLKAPFFLSQAFAQQLGPDQRGHIVNIADWRATRPAATYLAYTFSKAALISMTRSLAVALGPRVQVNAIAPGLILPPPGKTAAYFERMAQRVPLQRVGSPEEVAGAMLFLLRSDFVTGELLFVTGGEHL